MKTMNNWLVALAVGSALTLTACSDSEQDNKPANDQKVTESQASKAEKTAAEQKEIVVYSSRKEHLIKPFFEQFTKETGIPVVYITDGAAPLISRLKAEGERSPADILMTVD